MDVKKVYVAGKLNADAVGYLHNCHKMMSTAELLKEAGYSVYVPCLDLLMGIAFGWQRYEDYFDNSQPWLEVSDALFLTPDWETSSGTIREIERAWSKDIPVFDALDDMWNHFRGVPGGAIVDFKRDIHNAVIGAIKVRTEGYKGVDWSDVNKQIFS